MSTIRSAPLGGFEERLLTQLRAEVASRPASASQTSSGAGVQPRLRGRRAMALLTAVAAAIATILLILSVLAGSQPALAQAFPLLGGRPHSLSALVKRILRSERATASNAWVDGGRAFPFRTGVGAGYAVVDAQSQSLCLVVPGIGSDRESVHCETASHVLAPNSPGIRLVAEPRAHEEIIVELLRAGAKAAVSESPGASSAVDLRNGILTLVTRRPVTIATTLNGRQLSTTYDLGPPLTTAAATRLSAPACSSSSRSANRCSRPSVSSAVMASISPLRRPGGNCPSAAGRSRSTEPLGGRPKSSTPYPSGTTKPAACTSE